MSMNILNDISSVYLKQVAESAVPGKPAEKLGAVTAIPKSEQEAARERLLAKAKAKRESMKEERNDEPGEGTRQKYGDMRGLDRSGPPTSFGGKWQSKERKAAGAAALAKLRKEALDPVGHEDKDIDNDGDHDKSDKYLLNRRKVRGSAIAKKKMKESFSNWRQDLSEVMDDVEAKKEIKEKKVNNKITINPDFKESVENMGGELLEMVEVDEAVYGGQKEEPKDTRYTVTAADKKGNTSAYQKYKAGDKKYKAAPHLGEENEIDEGMTMKDFKANRRKLKRREASADAKKRGHVGKEWYNSGRTYSPDEAKSGRAKLDDAERSTRHRSALDPEGDDRLYSADKTKNPKKLRKQKAMGELGEGTLQEKALSKQQQKFMGMVYAVKKGDMKAPSPEVAKAAAGMTKQQAKDFAKTKHKGLPQVKEQMDEPVEPAVDKASEMQKKKIQVQKVKELTTRLQSARKGVY